MRTIQYSDLNGIFMIMGKKVWISLALPEVYKFLAPGWTVVRWLGSDVLLTNACLPWFQTLKASLSEEA